MISGIRHRLQPVRQTIPWCINLLVPWRWSPRFGAKDRSRGRRRHAFGRALFGVAGCGVLLALGNHWKQVELEKSLPALMGLIGDQLAKAEGEEYAIKVSANFAGTFLLIPPYGLDDYGREVEDLIGQRSARRVAAMVDSGKQFTAVAVDLWGNVAVMPSRFTFVGRLAARCRPGWIIILEGCQPGGFRDLECVDPSPMGR